MICNFTGCYPFNPQMLHIIPLYLHVGTTE